jgi:hypothetical protein
MKSNLFVGIMLMLIGAVVLGYDQFSYTTMDNILQIGPITATAERTHTVSLPPIIGWALILGGACMLAFAALSRKD